MLISPDKYSKWFPGLKDTPMPDELIGSVYDISGKDTSNPAYGRRFNLGEDNGSWKGGVTYDTKKYNHDYYQAKLKGKRNAYVAQKVREHRARKAANI